MCRKFEAFRSIVQVHFKKFVLFPQACQLSWNKTSVKASYSIQTSCMHVYFDSGNSVLCNICTVASQMYKYVCICAYSAPLYTFWDICFLLSSADPT